MEYGQPLLGLMQTAQREWSATLTRARPTRGHAVTLTNYLLKLLLLQDCFGQGCGYQCWVGESAHTEGMQPART